MSQSLSDNNNRYNILHKHNKISFILKDFNPDLEECRFLILKLIEQATQDYLTLYDTISSKEEIDWITAAAFIFDDDYLFLWGNWEISPEQFLDIVDIDIKSLRENVSKRFAKINGDLRGKKER